MKIGVFDSGVGGITVLQELRKHFPYADYIYLGDTANLPYGTKSPAQVEKLSTDCAIQLKSFGADLVVVACNTASSLALPLIKAALGDTPVFGVVEPGVECILATRKESDAVLILATRATIQSASYRNALTKNSQIEFYEQACPLLVPMIEEGWTDHSILKATVREYTEHFREMKHPGVALLACTHYPWIQQQFEDALPGWTVLNSATAVAKYLATKVGLGIRQLKNETISKIEWVFTDSDAVPKFARDLFSKI